MEIIEEPLKNKRLKNSILRDSDSLLIEKKPLRRSTITDLHEIIGNEKRNMASLDALYKDSKVYYGDLHTHSNSGGTSDGKIPLCEWVGKMNAINLDFVAIVDHRQIRHMFLSEWDSEYFICGTEPGGIIVDLSDEAKVSEFHYNMLFPNNEDLEKVLKAFPEYKFTGGIDGYFDYPEFTRERFSELADVVRKLGGCMVHAHPKDLMVSTNPLDFYLGEYTYIETFYDTMSSYLSLAQYELWVALLQMGKKVYACAGSDTHSTVTNRIVSTIYSPEKKNTEYIRKMYNGDLTAGSFGIKMSIGETRMGGTHTYTEGDMLKIRVDNLYSHHAKPNTKYVINVLTDQGLTYSSEFDGTKPQELVLLIKDRAFYRVTVFNETGGFMMAIGNPIWLIHPPKHLQNAEYIRQVFPTNPEQTHPLYI